MKKTFTFLAVLFLLATQLASADPKFPTLEQQLKAAHAKKGSALEKLIKDNQDFTKLKAKDATDTIVPPWLKVYWRKGHPEGK